VARPAAGGCVLLCVVAGVQVLFLGAGAAGVTPVKDNSTHQHPATGLALAQQQAGTHTAAGGEGLRVGDVCCLSRSTTQHSALTCTDTSAARGTGRRTHSSWGGGCVPFARLKSSAQS
jgi:hypothetical protein